MVAFEEALTVFADPLARIFDDEQHSADERRELIIGHSIERRMIVVCFTDSRNENPIVQRSQSDTHRAQRL